MGFSSHYSISFETPRTGSGRSVDKLALPADLHPARAGHAARANRRSTGVGVRPRGDRIEITATSRRPPALMIATATLITGSCAM
jgi:hypothetical protein